MLPTLSRSAAVCGLITFTLPIGLNPAEDDSKPVNPPTDRGRQEKPDDPWLERDSAWGRSPAGSSVAGEFMSIQVNLDARGFNILGDAANEPSIVVDPTAPNRMAIGWRQFDTINSNFRQAGWGYSNDGGRTWTFPGVIEPGIFRSDPVLEANADGEFFYNSFTGAFCTVFKSTDGGMSWDEGVYAFGGDKTWMAIDRTGGLGHGNIYHAWDHFGCCGDNWFTRSTDGGQSFESPVPIPEQPIWGVTTVGPNGEVYVAGRRVLTNTEYVVAKSTTVQDPNAPLAFDFAVEIDLAGNFLFAPGFGPNPGGLLGQVWVAVDHSDGPTRGNVYVLSSVEPTGDDPMDVHFIRSTDGGATWSDPVRVNDDAQGTNAWQWFGTMSVASNGRIDVIFNDTRNSGVENISELFYTFSTDAGETWAANVPVSSSFNSWLGWPAQNKIGDYYDMISDDVGANLAWAATFNGEQDVYYLRIGDYDCNANGVPDGDDLDLGNSEDCNANGIPDECEIAAGTVEDENGNGIPDECEAPPCPWDLDNNGSVGASDLLSLLANWGPCKGCPADFDGTGNVGASDLLALLANWGPCP